MIQLKINTYKNSEIYLLRLAMREAQLFLEEYFPLSTKAHRDIISVIKFLDQKLAFESLRGKL